MGVIDQLRDAERDLMQLSPSLAARPVPDSAPQVVRLPCCAAPPADPTRCPDVLCRARREAMGRAPVVRVIEIQQGAPVNA